MSAVIQPKLRFLGADFPDVRFSSFKFKKEETKVEINIKRKVFYPEDRPNDFNIIMEVTISCEDYFELNLSAIGNFILGDNLSDEIKKNLINVNAPAILFPYVRSFITTLTSNLGKVTSPIVIPPHFFSGELEEYKPSK